MNNDNPSFLFFIVVVAWLITAVLGVLYIGAVLERIAKALEQANTIVGRITGGTEAKQEKKSK